MYTLRMTKKKELLQNVEVTGLSYKGHAVAVHPNDGREIHILGAVPGDILDIEIYKRVKDIYYADVLDVKVPSKCRVEPKEGEVYMSTSPWQIFDFNCENKFKKYFVKKFFKEHADTELDSEIFFPEGFDIYGYRNKIEYGFWRDKESGKYSFSFFKRGSSRGKIPVLESALNHPKINKVGKLFLEKINEKNIEFGILKYLILRYSYFTDSVVAELIIQKDDFEALQISKEEFEEMLSSDLQGVVLSYSPENTPGARVEKVYFSLGDTDLKERIAGNVFKYKYNHFFQVYVPLFDFVFGDMHNALSALQQARGESWNTLLDAFAGVGVFGIALREFASQIRAIEISPDTAKYAKENAKLAGINNYEFIETDTDKALEYFEGADLLILDPPRAGVPKDTIKTILKEKPDTIVYLSCNPKTQAMDYNWLKNDYEIVFNKGYNLFPRTPHIEHLLILNKK